MRSEGVAGSLAAVVVSHASETDLPGCLGALVEASGVDRVVVVDNASPDRSVAVAQRDLGFRGSVLALDHNAGFAGGCNTGFQAVSAAAEFVAFLNPDVAVAPDCLARSAEHLAAHPELAGVAPRLMRPDGTTVDSVGQVLHPVILEVRDRGYGRPLTDELLEPRPVLAACGALAVFRRSALVAVAGSAGPFAEHYFCFWEDLELGWRLNNAGWRIETLLDAVAVHGRGAGAQAGRGRLRWRRPVELEACILTNRWMTLIRHLHPLDLAPRLPALAAWDLSLVLAGMVRRPRLLAAVRDRLGLVRAEWCRRRDRPRRRLAELP